MKCILVNFAFQLFAVFQLFIQKTLNFSYKVAYFLTLKLFMLVNRFLRLKNLNTKQAMNMKNSLYNLYDCAFKVFTIGLLHTPYIFLRKTSANVVAKIQNFPNMSKFIIYFSQNLVEVLNSKTI